MGNGSSNGGAGRARAALHSADWFRRFDGRKESGLRPALIRIAIGTSVGALFFAGSHRWAAAIVWAITAALGALSLSPGRGRVVAARMVARFSEAVGRLAGWLLLTPIYLVLFTAARVVGRVSGSDCLHLRDRHLPSYWLACDQDIRKVRHIRAMFTTEPAGARPRSAAGTLVVLAVLAFLSEGLLRMLGFGHPILYRVDSRVGYYPAPGQQIRRYGGSISINSLGMRAPEYPARKPAGRFRILMLGDSTLYGGSYIDQGELYARRLEKLLNEQGGGRQVEVLNMSANGWGPFHELGYVGKFGTFESDLAIVCLPIGDIYRPMFGLEKMPMFSDQTPPKLGWEEMLNHLAWRYHSARAGWIAGEDNVLQGRRGIEAYRALAEMLKQTGCEVLVEVLPSRTAGTSAQVPAAEQADVSALREALDADGVPCGFPAGFFAGKGKLADLYHDDCHLHREGHKVYAQFLADIVRHRSSRYQAWEQQPTRLVGALQ